MTWRSHPLRAPSGNQRRSRKSRRRHRRYSARLKRGARFGVAWDPAGKARRSFVPGMEFFLRDIRAAGDALLTPATGGWRGFHHIASPMAVRLRLVALLPSLAGPPAPGLFAARRSADSLEL